MKRRNGRHISISRKGAAETAGGFAERVLGNPAGLIELRGAPNPRQALFFRSTARYTAYGGARGGGKSWALRRKLVLMCERYPGLACLLVRRTYAELESNHIRPLRRELEGYAEYSESKKLLAFPNGSYIQLGYLGCDSHADRYQGMEYDVIALDEATQFSERHFDCLRSCLRGTGERPRRMFLTCNPGGAGHAWVKRLFVDREYREGERPGDYVFIPASVYDNKVLMDDCPEYVASLKSLPDKLRRAWLEGSWDSFDGQFFAEFSEERHVAAPDSLPDGCRRFAALDYGFDMLAALWFAVDCEGRCYVYRELCRPNLTLSAAADAIAEKCEGENVEYIAAPPDLWNRRQDSGYSGVEIMSAVRGLPPMVRADARRVMGWLTVREYLNCKQDGGKPKLAILSCCRELIRCLPSLVYAEHDAGDASIHPHEVTHLPDALRYGLMSRAEAPNPGSEYPDISRFLTLGIGAKSPGIADYM
ncbi:MAG: hypothetical protein GX628_00690 [Clostridiales bacterium]|nr:hypothetical protein [Clostridiales bacterium]